MKQFGVPQFGAILFALAAFFFAIALVNVCFWPGVRRRVTRSSVSLLIPARNEEDNLPECLIHAISTSAKQILVYDDHSSDSTANIVRAFSGVDVRVQLVEPEPLPAGWAGKSFACHRLALAATSDWFLFIDADVRITSDAPARIAAEAEARQVTLLSCWPGFEMRSFWERVLMPMLNFVVFSLFPSPLMFLRNDASLGLAHGACILAQRKAYGRTGGHSLVRNELFEDTRLAQRWRRVGERGICLDGSALVNVRMYSNLSGIWSGFQKNFYPAFHHKVNYWIFLALHLGVFLTPFAVGFWSAGLLVLATRVVLALRFRQPLWSVLLHPLAEFVLIVLGLASFWRVALGHGVTWKGRAYRTT